MEINRRSRNKDGNIKYNRWFSTMTLIFLKVCFSVFNTNLFDYMILGFIDIMYLN